MRRVLAFLDGSPCSVDVLAVAHSLAALNGGVVDAVTVVEPGAVPPSETAGRVLSGPVVPRLGAELGHPDVVAGVIGSRAVPDKPDALGHVTRAVAVRSTVPLVVVPPGARPVSGDPMVILVPLDGESPTSSAVMPLIERLPPDLTEVVVLHVFHSESLPPMASSPEDIRTLAEEFGLVHCGGVVDRVELRLGAPAREILAVAAAVEADLVLVAWQQNLTPGRAAVVRRLLEFAATRHARAGGHARLTRGAAPSRRPTLEP